MQLLTLAPTPSEIVVNSGSAEGAVDIFSYGPEMEPAARTLGSLFVVGWRRDDTNTMGYMVSLIAALARREYYAQPQVAPKEAFARTLKKINEVADEFFKSSGVKLAVGIFALAAGSIMVSRLDKFKILLARDGQVIDILNNVALFSKEHVEKRQFSSIISGSIQAGDRLLAYHPSRIVTSRERLLKGWLVGSSGPELSEQLAQLGAEHPEFSASFVHVDIGQLSAPPAETDTQPAELTEPAPTPSPALAWAPRQNNGHHKPAAEAAEAPAEIPRIIAAEFALGTRRSKLSRMLSRLRFIRLDGRGKAITLAAAIVIIIGGVLLAKSLLFVSPEQKKVQQALETIEKDVQLAQSKTAENNFAEARQIMVRALSALSGSAELKDNNRAKELTASVLSAMDNLDNAQAAAPTVVAQLDADTDRVTLAVWSSPSQSIWAVTAASDDTRSVVKLENGMVSSRTVLTDIQPDLLVGWRNGVLALDTAARTIARVEGGQMRKYVIPVQEQVLDAVEFSDNLYVLTDHSILKVSDLDTDKPVTKTWLNDNSKLAAGAVRLWVDGNVYVMTRDGILATYYKGKPKESVQSSLQPSGKWVLVPAGTDELAVASADRIRVYVISITDGSLLRTLKVDTEQPFLGMSAGPDGSVLLLSKDNRIWSLK